MLRCPSKSRHFLSCYTKKLIYTKRRDSNEKRQDVKAIAENAYRTRRLPAPPVYGVHIGEYLKALMELY